MAGGRSTNRAVELTTQCYLPVISNLAPPSSILRFNLPVRRLIRQWFDPAERGEVGRTPDYRFSLANERTFLAWIRTGLALVGGGLAIAAFVPPLRWPFVREAIAISLILLGAVVSLRAVDHWARSERAMRLDQPLPPSRFPAVLALIISGGAVVLLLIVILSGVRR